MIKGCTVIKVLNLQSLHSPIHLDLRFGVYITEQSVLRVIYHIILRDMGSGHNVSRF